MNTEILTDGIPLNEAKKALILIHGRGASAHDILSIAKHLKVDDFALMAPPLVSIVLSGYCIFT